MRFATLHFLSDYGLVDEFVAVTKSVVWSITPDVRIVDITHDVAPFDVRGAGYSLARAAGWLNPGVVMAVVDPGVATNRRAVAVEVGDGASILVGPDNGLLAPAVAMVGGATAAVDITNSRFRIDAPGPTFDGRDLFAPVAAQLCAGTPLAEVGEPIEPSLLMPAVVPVTATEGDVVVAEVLWIDRYGNAQLNVDPDELTHGRYSLQVESQRRGAARVESFSGLAAGEVGLIVDSYGMIAVVANKRSAAAELELSRGTEVRLHPAGEDSGVSTPVTIGRAGS